MSARSFAKHAAAAFSKEKPRVRRILIRPSRATLLMRIQVIYHRMGGHPYFIELRR